MPLQVAQSHELLLRRVRETCRSAVVHDECMGQAKRFDSDMVLRVKAL